MGCCSSLRRGHLYQTSQECLHALELLKQRRGQTPTVGYLHLELAALDSEPEASSVVGSTAQHASSSTPSFD